MLRRCCNGSHAVMKSDAVRGQVKPPQAAIVVIDAAFDETTLLEVINEQADIGAVDADPRCQSDLIEARLVAQEGKRCILERSQILLGKTLGHCRSADLLKTAGQC